MSCGTSYIQGIWQGLAYWSSSQTIKSFRISGQIYGLISSFSVIDVFECFWIKSLHKNIQLMLPFLKAPFSVLHFSYYTLMIFLTVLSVILLSMLMILLSIQSGIRHLISDLLSDPWRQLELISELESDLRDTVDWGNTWVVDFNAGKTQLVLFDQSNNNDSIDVNINRSVLEEESSFKMLGLNFSSKLDWGPYISIAKTDWKLEL